MDNEQELIVKMPKGITAASYKISLNGERLLNFIFAKIDYITYMVKEDRKIEISSQEWGRLFDLKSPWRTLQDGANALSDAVFKFQHKPTKEYKMLEEMEYDEGVLTLSLKQDFLIAAMRDESGELNPILDVMFGTA